MKFTLIEVERFPATIEPGCLYWSREFKLSAHRCACGCGDVIDLPVDEMNYSIRIGPNGVTLRPSIGNWGVCDAHYFITDGGIEWATQWSPNQIATARAAEGARRDAYYANPTLLQRFRRWLGGIWNWLRSQL